MRVLVTGSRDWADPDRVDEMLCEVLTDFQTAPPRRAVVVHGACPTGADEHASRAVRRLAGLGAPVTEEPHPADWNAHGRAAGPLRNKAMVDLGANVCLAFISDCTSPRCRIEGKHPSHGASGCADLAEAAGITVYRFSA